MTGIGIPVLVALAAIGLVAGIGITAIGPGGVLVTIGLFALTELSPAQVAGTAMVTHIATGLVGTAAFARSGQLSGRDTRRTAIVLAATAVVGTPIGVVINGAVSADAFGVLLAVFVVIVAALVLYRDRRTDGAAPLRHPGTGSVVLVGFAVSVASGIVGVGGPMLSVPLLIAAGVPMLSALAAAQAQSVVIASVGSAGYLLAGSIDWPLALLVGVPELLGVVLGWMIARRVPTRVLSYALVISLFALAPYLALAG